MASSIFALSASSGFAPSGFAQANTFANLNISSNWKMVTRHEPTLTEPFVPAQRLPGSPCAAAPPPYISVISTTTLQPGSRILVRFKPTGHHSEIDNNLKHLVFERLIL